MFIRQAIQEDVDLILQVIEQAKLIMRATGNYNQWINGYPSFSIISNDVANKNGFVCIANDEIVGYFCFIHGNDPEPNYKIIEGQWINNQPYGVIHRLASNNKVKGVARIAFDYATSIIHNIRVDTDHHNLPMQNFLKKENFIYCGIIYVNDGTPRDAFQKA
jgi:hypothetical protein